MRFFSRIVMTLCVIIALAYIGLFAFGWLAGRKLVFPMPASSYSHLEKGWFTLPYQLAQELEEESGPPDVDERVSTSAPDANATVGAAPAADVPAADAAEDTSPQTMTREGAVVARIVEAAEPKGYILYQHGNNEDLGTITQRLETLRDLGWTVLAWDYPGYGMSPDTANEASVSAAAEAVAAYARDTLGWPVEATVIYGRSVGGGPSTLLATQTPYRGLILEGTFTSAFRVVTRLKLLPFDVFDNWARIGEIQTPVLFLHGTSDEVVPFSHGQRLYASAPEPKAHAWIEGGKHNDLPSEHRQAYLGAVADFLDHLPPPAAASVSPAAQPVEK